MAGESANFGLRDRRPGHADVRYAEAKRHIGETQFAWIGPFDDASPFYYRILSPVILVEFDHQSVILYVKFLV